MKPLSGRFSSPRHSRLVMSITIGRRKRTTLRNVRDGCGRWGSGLGIIFFRGEELFAHRMVSDDDGAARQRRRAAYRAGSLRSVERNESIRLRHRTYRADFISGDGLPTDGDPRRYPFNAKSRVPSCLKRDKIVPCRAVLVCHCMRGVRRAWIGRTQSLTVSEIPFEPRRRYFYQNRMAQHQRGEVLHVSLGVEDRVDIDEDFPARRLVINPSRRDPETCNVPFNLRFRRPDYIDDCWLFRIFFLFTGLTWIRNAKPALQVRNAEGVRGVPDYGDVCGAGGPRIFFKRRVLALIARF